ncbi:hypothetical protein GOP47_0002836 [Adiantum capillus-veneris]|uniref:ABC1 atypical kinase-like domain-containing protein n=1 Tax=Adiantum capillus-veneris TaxID=13818 RepID=A0A9D4ZPI2_ADICA|nr:hypothetical protein GOP47_0002836 [Adiantum capillus-veneris]
MTRGAGELAKLLRYRPKFAAASFSSTTPSGSSISPTHRPWFPKLKVVAAVGVGLGMGALGLSALGTEPRRSLYLLYSMSLRLGRDFVTAALIVADYNYSLYGLPEKSLERAQSKHEVHIRSANRLKELCFKNGGIYIKLGQHMGQLEYLLPSEYVQTMKDCMLDKCPVSTFEQVCELFKAELGRLPHEVFKDFDPIPLASASLAQVHVASTFEGEKVAVKVQHAHLTDTAAMDIVTVKLVVTAVHFLFPNYDYRWLIAEVQDSLPKELDFLLEAKNSEHCMNNFRTLSPHLVRWIYVPKVYRDLSTRKLLTMEFIEGVKVTDVKAIQKLGIKPNTISKIMNEAFADMIFRHGFVHCDPHAANMMVRLAPTNEHGFLGNKKTPQLVLLDHGLYKELNPTLRNDYAALWKALVFADVNEIKKQSVKLGAGEDLYILFAGVLTMRPWKKIIQQDINHLKIDGTEEDKEEIQMYASQLVSEISLLLQRLPREILLLLKTNDCLRAVDYCLGSSINSFVIIARESSRTLAEMRTSRDRRSIRSKLSARLDMLKVEVRLLILQLLEWITCLHGIDDKAAMQGDLEAGVGTKTQNGSVDVASASVCDSNSDPHLCDSGTGLSNLPA